MNDKDIIHKCNNCIKNVPHHIYRCPYKRDFLRSINNVRCFNFKEKKNAKEESDV